MRINFKNRCGKVEKIMYDILSHTQITVRFEQHQIERWPFYVLDNNFVEIIDHFELDFYGIKVSFWTDCDFFKLMN